MIQCRLTVVHGVIIVKHVTSTYVLLAPLPTHVLLSPLRIAYCHLYVCLTVTSVYVLLSPLRMSYCHLYVWLTVISTYVLLSHLCMSYCHLYVCVTVTSTYVLLSPLRMAYYQTEQYSERTVCVCVSCVCTINIKKQTHLQFGIQCRCSMINITAHFNKTCVQVIPNIKYVL